MAFMRNMSIKNRLFLGFGFLIAVTVFISIFAANGKTSMQWEAEYVIEGPFRRYAIIRDIEHEILDTRRIMNRISMYGGTASPNQQAIDTQESAFNTNRQNVTRLIAEYRNSMDTLNTSTQETINSRHLIVDRLADNIDIYWDTVEQIIFLARLGNIDAAIELTVQSAGVIDNVYEPLNELIGLSVAFMDASTENLAAHAGSTIIAMWIVVAVGAVIGIIFAVFTTKSITDPVKDLVVLVDEVTHGKLSVNFDQSKISKDEIGILTHDVYDLIKVIKNIMQDLSSVHYNFVELGNINYKIDASGYQNSFKEMIDAINNLIMEQISEGNFDVHVVDLPGDKIVLPQTIRAVTTNLKDIYESVLYLANCAANGKLDVEIDPSKFKGSWGELVNTLNRLAKAIEVPLSEIEHNVLLMSQGDFSMTTGDFKGHFKEACDACDLNNTSTLAIIEEISNVLTDIAAGDLTDSVKGDYVGSYAPIKKALVTILESLNTTMTDIYAVVDQVAMGAEQISMSAMNLAEGATKQTASIEELSSSLAIIQEKATQSSSDAISAEESTIRSQEYAMQGRTAVQSMTDTIHKIKSSSEGIAKIIDVIANIAFQTNLLALNASVEAARAGEHGKGFSVVADEVRTLAGRSQQSTSDTTVIIDEDTKNVEEGIKAAAEVVASFETIAGNISEISNLVSHIAGVSAEQLESISNINASVSEITRVVTDTSATAEESAAASQELSSQADMLRQKVAYFKLAKAHN